VKAMMNVERISIATQQGIAYPTHVAVTMTAIWATAAQLQASVSHVKSSRASAISIVEVGGVVTPKQVNAQEVDANVDLIVIPAFIATWTLESAN
jgi:hypothetical protein